MELASWKTIGGFFEGLEIRADPCCRGDGRSGGVDTAKAKEPIEPEKETQRPWRRGLPKKCGPLDPQGDGPGKLASVPPHPIPPAAASSGPAAPPSTGGTPG